MAPKPSTLSGMAHDCRGSNFFEIDKELQGLLSIHLPRATQEAVTPHLARLGLLAGTRLDELAFVADQNPPRLHSRTRLGNEEDWIEYHPSYRELEQAAYCEFGIHAIGKRGSLLGVEEPLGSLIKYTCQYLFVQAEFGLICPVAMTDSCGHVVEKYGSEQVKALFLKGLTANTVPGLLKGAQMMTERQAGSDVGAILTRAEKVGDHWQITGEKWFCSAADADVVMVLARSDPDSRGTVGLSLFAVPRVKPDGTRNSYVVRKLKSKLGTRSMPTGEIDFNATHGYLVGEVGQGLKIVLDQVNMSRLSHGVRAAAMMRRCLNEAMVTAATRSAFGAVLLDNPMVRHQLLDIKLPAEQALSMFVNSTRWLDAAVSGDPRAKKIVRVLTPLLKLGACRDNVTVATAAMELRGGNGFIADYVNERLIRDAHTGLIWEGTSNIVALDLLTRAVGKDKAHIDLLSWISEELDEIEEKGVGLRLISELRTELARAAAMLERMSESTNGFMGGVELGMHFYHVVSAALMAKEGFLLLNAEGNGKRMLLSQLILKRRVLQRTTPPEPVLPSLLATSLSEVPVDAHQLQTLLGDPINE